MRAQEQFNALGQLGQVVGQARGADEGMSQFNAGQGNQMQQANMQAMMQQLGLNQSGELQALMAAMGSAGPGMGTQILAGGANAMPQFMQMNQQQKQQNYMQQQRAAQDRGGPMGTGTIYGNGYDNGSYGNPNGRHG